MDVILMQNVDNLGRVGETVSVAAGYARNFLIPKGMAVVASESQRKVVEQHIAREAKHDLQRKAGAEALAAQIGELSCTIPVQADDDEKLYGSVGPRDIAAALESEKVEIGHHMVALAEPIKQLGVYTVPIRLHHDVQVEAKVWVVRA